MAYLQNCCDNAAALYTELRYAASRIDITWPGIGLAKIDCADRVLGQACHSSQRDEISNLEILPQ